MIIYMNTFLRSSVNTSRFLVRVTVLLLCRQESFWSLACLLRNLGDEFLYVESNKARASLNNACVGWKTFHVSFVIKHKKLTEGVDILLSFQYQDSKRFISSIKIHAFVLYFLFYFIVFVLIVFNVIFLRWFCLC